MKLNPEGFLLHYLISGMKRERFSDTHLDKNQLRYEKYLRSIVAETYPSAPPKDIRLGKPSELGLPWEYYYNHSNWFVDRSAFYDHLEHLELTAVSGFHLNADTDLNAVLWTFGAAELWLDDTCLITVSEPVYKPIRKVSFRMHCPAGTHRLYIRFQNLGVRDTRNVFGIQFLNAPADLEVQLPDPEHSALCLSIAEWLDGLTLSSGKLLASSPAPFGIRILCRKHSFDAARILEKECCFAEGETEFLLPDGYEDIFVSALCCDSRLERKFNRLDQMLPRYAPAEDPVSHTVSDLAASGQLFRPLYNVLARCGTNQLLPGDDAEIEHAISLIASRMDCSDFLMAVLLRLMKHYPLPARLAAMAKDAILDYRYWMDEEGSDGMCFWSENHALTFYGCQMIAGSFYPEEWFPRAKKNGQQMQAEGEKKVRQWLHDIERDGLEEFLSSGYTAVTFGALLNIVDFAPKALSVQAARILDQMFRTMAQHTFRGSVLAPQGRVYREVLTPFSTSTQSLLYLIDPKLPYETSEWLAFLPTTTYQLPYEVRDLFSKDVNTVYTSGNAEIHLYKKKDYLLTSVTSRHDRRRNIWDFIDVEQSDAVADFSYVKSMNEKYHGTTRFAPGIFGYQQHLWYAALDNTCFLFANLPGGSCDASSQRPGYWYGNGILPALWQEENRLGCIFHISEEHPIPFTHLFFPKMRFDYTLEEEHWLFGVKGDGFAAVWCSRPLIPFSDQLEACEFRAYGPESAYYVFCLDRQNCSSLEQFRRLAKEQNPHYQDNVLTAAGDFRLVYEACRDTTQYI